MFFQNTEIPFRYVSAQTSICYRTIWTVLRIELRQTPCKLQIGSEISLDDKVHRVSFIQFCRQKIFELNPGSREKIVFSDEWNFSLSGSAKKQNCPNWGTKRPEIVHEVPQSAPSVMVECGVSSREFVGPSFFEYITGES